jgi:hypothetical protein
MFQRWVAPCSMSSCSSSWGAVACLPERVVRLDRLPLGPPVHRQQPTPAPGCLNMQGPLRLSGVPLMAKASVSSCMASSKKVRQTTNFWRLSTRSSRPRSMIIASLSVQASPLLTSNQVSRSAFNQQAWSIKPIQGRLMPLKSSSSPEADGCSCSLLLMESAPLPVSETGASRRKLARHLTDEGKTRCASRRSYTLLVKDELIFFITPHCEQRRLTASYSLDVLINTSVSKPHTFDLSCSSRIVSSPWGEGSPLISPLSRWL